MPAEGASLPAVRTADVLCALMRDRRGRSPRLGTTWARIITLALLFVVVGCSENVDNDSSIPVLRVGVVPDDEPEVIDRRHALLLEYLEQVLDTKCELIVADSYESFLASYRNGEIDVAHFGGFTFVAANELKGAVPLVMRQEDRHFVSYFLVSPYCAVNSVSDWRGGRFAFGSRLSTSGHLMPRHFMLRDGIDPDLVFDEIQYTDSHDATAFAVRDGRADLGVASALVIDRMFREGRLNADDVKILSETPPYVDYVWACRLDLPVVVRNAIRDAFLALDWEREDHRAVLSALDTKAYFPAGLDDFQDIELIVNRLDMLREYR